MIEEMMKFKWKSERMNEWANNFFAASFQFIRSIWVPCNRVSSLFMHSAAIISIPFWTFICYWKTSFKSKYLRRHHFVHSKWGLHCFRIDCFSWESERETQNDGGRPRRVSETAKERKKMSAHIQFGGKLIKESTHPRTKERMKEAKKKKKTQHRHLDGKYSRQSDNK